MLILAIIFFAVAALLGIYLLSFVLTNKNTPKGIAFIHGPLAAIGLLILIVYAAIFTPSPVMSTILFIFAAFMGFMLIFRDITGKSIPKWLAISHGIVAIISFMLLLLFFFYH